MRRIVAVVLFGVLAGACGRLGAPAGQGQPVRWGSAPNAAPPVVRATVPSGVTQALVVRARISPGVAALARAAVAAVTVKANGQTIDLALAAVRSSELRRVTSAATAGDVSLWAALRAGRVLLTRDQARRLRVRPGSHVRMQSPSGSPIRLRVGAVVPDEMGTVGGALVSAEQGGRFGIDTPNLLLVAAQSWEAVPTVTQTLTRLLRIGVQVPGLAFLTGSTAARAFGSFRYVINADGTIAQDAAWVRSNIVTARVPILGSVRCHRMMIPQLRAALGEIKRAGLAGAIDLADFRRSGGCYVARTQLWDPARPLSMHAWGLAVDINVAGNGYGATPHQDPRIVAAFERWGFRWGGRWSPPDGMHFELAALLSPTRR